jgi:hypothetical protein
MTSIKNHVEDPDNADERLVVDCAGLTEAEIGKIDDYLSKNFSDRYELIPEVLP